MKTLSTKADMEWRDGCGNIAQDRKSGVVTMDRSILGGPELNLVKSMDMTQCQQCVANDQPCIVRKTVNGKKFNACDACGTQRTKCNTLHNLSAIVNSDGQVIHAASSWDKLTNLKVKDTEGKMKAMTGKDKGKSQATDPEQDQEDDQWAFEPNPEPTPASQPELVSTIYQDLKLLTTLISRMRSLVHPEPKKSIP